MSFASAMAAVTASARWRWSLALACIFATAAFSASDIDPMRAGSSPFNSKSLALICILATAAFSSGVRPATSRASSSSGVRGRGSGAGGGTLFLIHASGLSPRLMHSTLRLAARPRAAAWIFKIIACSPSSNPARSGMDSRASTEPFAPSAGESLDEDFPVAALRRSIRPR